MFNQKLHVPESIKMHLNGDVFDACMNLQGKAFRDVPGRKTIQVALGDKSYFIKQHFGVGWGEIFKNLSTFKTPILGAMTEVQAIKKLDEMGIKTTPLVAYGQRGCNPAKLQSFVLTEDLGEILTLEDVLKVGLQPNIHAPSRPAILIALAQLAAKLHGAGLVHRDFYLCHFVVKKDEFESGNLNLYLIDLHRMLQDQFSQGNSVMKDMAGLYFSMQQIGLNADDWAVFKQYYLPHSDDFWAQVATRAEKLLAKFNSQKFQARLAADRNKLDNH